MNLRIYVPIAFALTLTVAGCAGAKVTTEAQQAPAVTTRPDTVAIYPFAVSASEVTLNQSIFQRAYRQMSDTNQADEQLKLADHTAHNICVQVAAKMTQKGIAAACLDRGVPPTGNNVMVIDGQFTDISEGNRLRRMVIGLGSGQSTLDTAVQAFQKNPDGTQQLMDFTTHADSGYMPGAGITGPAGAAAGGATAAASLGVNLAASGVKGVTSSTGFLADKTATQIADQISAYYSKQGWGGM
jgi:hypothetical protein